MKKILTKVWKAKDGWRWHMLRSGRIVAESGEAYVRPSGARKALGSLVKAIAAGAVTVSCLALMISCATTTAYNTLSTVKATTDSAVTGYFMGVVSGQYRTNEVPTVAKAYDLFEVGFESAVIVARSSNAPPTVVVLSLSSNVLWNITQAKLIK